MSAPVSAPLDPATGAPFALYPDKSAWGVFRAAVDEDRTRLSDNRFQAMVRDSALNVFDGSYQRVFADRTLTPQAKAAYVAGRLVHDVVNDGSRVPWWVLNHPMAQTAVASDIAADSAGLNPDVNVYSQQLEGRGETPSREAIDAAFARDMGFSYRGEGNGIPLGLARKVPAVLASAAMLAASGNSDFLNVTGGGRLPGFAAVLPTEGDPARSENPLLELGARYLFGRTGRLLPWEQFTAERPDVSPGDYQSYRAHQFDSGPLLGLIKGTDRNVDGEPEFTMMGFRVPLSAASSAAGTLAGTVAGARLADRIAPPPAAGQKAAPRGHRRLAGAALGGLLGAIGGRAGASALNAAVLQPALNPDAVAEAAAWQEQQRAAGLL